MDYVQLLVGFIIIIKGADYLVVSASKLARSFGISTLVIGLSLIAFGTSAPELTIGVISGIEKANGVTLGDVIGSNIANIALIVGATAVIRPIVIQRTFISHTMPISVGMQTALFLLALIGGVLSRIDGVILLLLFIGYMIYLFFYSKNAELAHFEQGTDEEIDRGGRFKLMLLCVLGLIGLSVGGKLVVDNSIRIAEGFGVSKELVGATVVAFGTSLPELITSAVAAVRKESGIAIGNIVGSNIFNSVFVMGVSVSIFPIPADTSAITDMAIMLVLSLVLLMISAMKKVVSRSSGVFLLICYVLFILFKIFSI
jgi:cation:H+ antiporter